LSMTSRTVEALFRQQFRREVRKRIYTLAFALSALVTAVMVDATGETDDRLTG
jgi:hypothetical protein